MVASVFKKDVCFESGIAKVDCIAEGAFNSSVFLRCVQFVLAFHVARHGLVVVIYVFAFFAAPNEVAV